MSATLDIHHARSGFNDLVSGCPPTWEWGKGRLGYDEGSNFFTVHWQVNFREDTPEEARIVRLHVESPRHAVDPSLNDIKRRVIDALLESNMQQVAQQHGYAYEIGRLTSVAQIQRNKSTEAFRVVLAASQLASTHDENITAVHTAVGSVVDAVLQQFANQLDGHIPASGPSSLR
jgi:hypothetical protein